MCGIWQLFIDHQSIDIEKYYKLFNNVKSRGPDNSNFITDKFSNSIIGFHRLAINGLTNDGMQPFYLEYKHFIISLICNGEIYNYKDLINKIKYTPKSNSDCEVLIPLLIYHNFIINEFINDINGEFSLVIAVENIKTQTKDIYIATDPLSVRPLFYQYIENKGLLVSSLLKGLLKEFKSYRLCQGQIIHFKQDKNGFVEPFDTLMYYEYKCKNFYDLNEDEKMYKLIVDELTKAVEKRLQSERPLCCLLSGGLDSSLIAGIAQRLIKKRNPNDTLHTFTIGMAGGSDLEYAKKVADFIGSKHTEILFTPDDGLNQIDNVIYACETFDITTIRASVGQNLIAKYISENTDFKVVLNGDGADEVEMGYIYFYLAPNENEAQKDSEKLVKNICKFDGLRVDRNISHYGLEARVPFLDKDFVKMYLSLDPKLKIPTKERMEKYLIRKAFDYIYLNDPIIPREILWRKKEAFSDGVSQKEKSWYVMTQEFGKSKISDEELKLLKEKYHDYIQPTSHESAYYRKKFDEFFGENAKGCIPYYWLPNWSDNKDPSARTLNIY